MNGIAWIQMFLALILVTSALPKLTGLTAFKKTLKRLGVTDKLVMLAIGIPLLELAAAVLILVSPLRFAGEVAILALLGCFLWATYKGMTGKAPVECSCFGSLTSETFGWTTLARIAVMLALDLILVFIPDAAGLADASLAETLLYFTLSISALLFYILYQTIQTYLNLLVKK
ncbi:MauE/DoxX family redox-associated membrane protein [Paenibacillus sp. GbtcB18]|uniref:MauE/DoxX family redox-associated membrane protein n=1 Tax=Paenibacillus sp. GbtcB18 TaxID=2824763 RepID=UPI001C2F0FFA|nr:MauE/DoxX family redox-associated membrane protein [Paenibacillus sp. GbtcB18]